MIQGLAIISKNCKNIKNIVSLAHIIRGHLMTFALGLIHTEIRETRGKVGDSKGQNVFKALM